MDFNVFSEEVKKHIRDLAGEEYEIRESEVLKSNGLLLHGISIRKKTDSVAPTFYLEFLFRQYGEEGATLEAAESVMKICRETILPRAEHLKQFQSYEVVKPLLSFQLLNEEMNQQMLREMPGEKVLDLALVLYAEVPDFTRDEAIVRIRREYLKHWNVTEEQLLADAKENAPLLQPPVVIAMTDIMEEITGQSSAPDLPEDSENWLENFRTMARNAAARATEEKLRFADMAPVLVLTNRKRHMGAGVMLYPGLLSVLREELGMDFYILPSSVHEVIIIGDDKKENSDELHKMVCEINHTELLQEDFLADSLYYYSEDVGEITLLC